MQKLSMLKRPNSSKPATKQTPPLVAALKEVASKADVLLLEANTYVASRDGDHYLYYTHGADAVKNAREQRVDALADSYSEILCEYQVVCKQYGI